MSGVMNAMSLVVTIAAATLIVGCASRATPTDQSYVRNRFIVRHDAEVRHFEPPPHGGGGESTAYRYFDDATDAKVIFRKRALHNGAFIVRHDAEVRHVEPPPHDGGGESTAYRYFDDATDAKVIFRKRALHNGAFIGMHVLKHDEVYYVVSGEGEVRIDDRRIAVGPGTAVFMYEGADVGVWQQGEADLVLIVAYPPAKR